MSSEPIRKPRVFISYCREDAATAEKMFVRLEQLGAVPWRDTEQIKAGKRWKREISHAIKESDFFIALLSTRSVTKKGYVQKEIREALEILESAPDDTAFIIPCRLDNCAPTHDKLHELQWVDLFPSFENGMKTIARGIELQYSSPFTSTSRKLSQEMHSKNDVNPHFSRVSFTLNEKSAAALAELQAHFGDVSQADIVRRALALYDVLQKERAKGSSLILDRDGEKLTMIFPS